MASNGDSLSEVHIGNVSGGIQDSIIAGRDVKDVTITIGGQATPADKQPTLEELKGLLADGDGGLVVNITSTAGVFGMGSNVAYCASKAALHMMTVSLARALAPKIRVMSVAPALVEGRYADQLDPEWVAEQGTKNPLPGLVQAKDVARAVLALATLLTFSTGSMVTVDGGRLLV